MAGVTLKHIHKSYDGQHQVINDVSLEIADGEFCVFVGPSGCGKSTLLRMVAGLEDISQGDLLVGGERVNERAPSERNVSMVFQNYALYPHMDVAQNIAFGLKLAGVDKTTITQRVQRIADTLQIRHLLERKPKALSGGQRQRVAIGRALVRDPGVFLFDEPLSNLDASLRTQMRVEIARMHRDYGRASTIYVTHDQVEAMTLADKIVLLHTGEAVARLGSVAQVGAPLELYRHPASLFVASFIGSPQMNFVPARVHALDDQGVQVQTVPAAGAAGASSAAGSTASLLRAAVAPASRPLQVGDAVTLGVRCEHLRLCEQPGANTLSCKVQWVEHLGDSTCVYLDRPGQAAGSSPMIARLPGDSPVAVGDALHLLLPPEACHLFDSQGLALRRLAAV